MSKQDKDRAETGDLAELTAESATPVGDASALPLATVQPEQEPGEAPQSRQFNSWLDRALPRLLEYLGAAPSSAVTSPGNKAKH